MFFRFCDVMIFYDKCSVSLGGTERNEELVCSLDAHMPALSRIMLLYVCVFLEGGGRATQQNTRQTSNSKKKWVLRLVDVLTLNCGCYWLQLQNSQTT